MECDLVEVSAHMGARPSHAAWQGKIYSLSGESKKYPSFYEVCKPGTPDGICGINCRHSYYPYFEGMSAHYTDDELDEMKEPSVRYNGQKITQYEAEQKLRACERNIRKYKRMAGSLDAAGFKDTEEHKMLGQWQAAARDIVKQTGIRRDYSREYAGTETGTQPRGIKPIIQKPKGLTTQKNVIDSRDNEFKNGTQNDWIRLKNISQHKTQITSTQRNTVYTNNWTTVADNWKIGDRIPKICAGRSENKYFNSGIGSQTINNAVRENKIQLLNQNQKTTVITLKKLIEKSPVIENMQVTRYVTSPWLKSQLPEILKGDYTTEIGKRITDNQFISVSVSKENVFTNRPVKLLINIPKGTNMYISENAMESEAVLFKPSYVVKKIEKTQYQIEITMEIVK